MHNIKRAIITPFVFFVAIIFSGYTALIYFHNQEMDERRMGDLTTNVSQYLENGISSDTQMLKATLSAIATNQQFKTSFLNGDRDKLFDLTENLFLQLRRKSGITHFYFTDADRVNFLRVHQNGRYDDIINRFTTLNAQKTGKSTSGIELGPLGTFTLRAVIPWRDNGKLIGYLELGKEINNVFKNLEDFFGGDNFVFVQKKYLDRERWESGMKMLKRSANWDRYDDVILTNQQSTSPSAVLINLLSDARFEESVLASVVTEKDRILTVVGYPLGDARKKIIGYFTLLLDVTSIASRHQVNFIQLALLTATSMIGTVLVFWLILARVEKRFFKTRQDLYESEQRLSLHIKNTPLGVIAWDMNFNCTQWNPAAEKIFGFSAEEALGSNALKLLVPKDIHDQIDGVFQALLNQSGGSRSINENKTRDGRTILCEWFNTPLKGENGVPVGVASMVRDITSQKAMETALQESEERFRSITKSSSDVMIVAADHNGIVISWNPGAEKSFGYSEAEMLGRPLIDIIPERLRADHNQGFQRAVNSNDYHVIGKTIEMFALRRNGKEFPIELSLGTWVQDDKKFFSAIIYDVTERRNLEEQARRSQKMAAVGQLTGGIAHDFNNILGIIMGNLELLTGMVVGDKKALKRIGIAYKGAQRGADITKKLLGFSSMEFHESRLTMINTFIGNLKYLIEKSLTGAIKVETHLADNLWLAALDPGDLEDTILNLSINARDAMPEGGTLIIETANEILGESYVQQNSDATPGEFIMISVTDTGTGMTNEVKERVLEPFFTTKEPGKGTGLGLSMVYGFVQRSGGYLKIYSEIGNGTTIRIYLPRAREEESTNNAENDISVDLPGGAETILVVDDEKGLLGIAIKYLEGLGYKTVSATTGDQALNVLRVNKDIDLLFSDIIMPGDLNGYQLAQFAHEENPALKILLTSGFTTKQKEYVNGENKFLGQLTAKLLSKPYNQSELALAIRKNLDEKI